MSEAQQRERVEEDLRRSEERYRLIVQNQTEFIVRWLPDGTRTFVNESYCKYFGLTEAQCLGTSFLPLVAPEYRATVAAKIASLTPGGPAATSEHRVLTPDGTVRWQQWTDRGIFDAAGRLVELQSVGRDVTEKKLVEEALEAERRRAEEERRRLEAQLAQSQKLQAVGQLAGGIAHDFNNILTVINGYTQVLLATADESTAASLREIQAAGQRAADLTRQLLAFGRRAVLEVQVVDLNALVRRLETMLRRIIGEDVTLLAELAPELRRVNVDPGQFERVLVNLVVNARDAMPGGGTLRIATADVELSPDDVRAMPEARAGSHVELLVSDTGVGMSDEVKARIFEPFFTTKEPGKGTGMGLAVVDGVVKQSGGHLTLESAPGLGTTFRIRIPIAAPASAPATGAPAAVVPTGARPTETVLLVEDADPVRSITEAALRALGYAVLTAKGGAAALALARERPFDLLVTDVVMPDMNGRQLADELRRLRPGLGVLFMSGFTADGAPPGAAFLAKPYTIEELGEKAREALGQRARTPSA